MKVINFKHFQRHKITGILSQPMFSTKPSGKVTGFAANNGLKCAMYAIVEHVPKILLASSKSIEGSWRTQADF